MASNFISEYRGFIRFLSLAERELIKWFGHHCNNDPSRIAFMASREWDGMADLERKPFLKLNPSNVSPYFKYLLHTRYSERGDIAFSPRDAKQHSENWRSLSPEQKDEFSSLEYDKSTISHVLEKRDALHQAYDPTKLSLLEFIIKTQPSRPTGPSVWYLRNECSALAPYNLKKRWLGLSEEERSIYERCAVLDKKRYDFEKNAWLTKVVSIDLEANTFTLSDFQIAEARSRIESLGSFVDLSRDLPKMVGLKRPRNPFSLFIEAYRYQIRDERPEFRFGRHLKECSEAWSKLGDQEREYYKEESKKLRSKRRELLAGEPCADSRLTIAIDLFTTNKSIYGPCRPAHLYSIAVPSAMAIYGRENRVAQKHLKSIWEGVPQETKELYEHKHRELRELRDTTKADVERKLKNIKKLQREAVKLKALKQELRLIGSSKKAVKNLYD